MLTLIDMLRRSEEYLRKHGVPEARRNAELLASHVLGKSRLDLYLEHERPLEKGEIDRLRDVLTARKARKPLQYIFGEAEFFGLSLDVDENVLIPRPETELLVEEALKSLGEMTGEKKIVYDIGTGSGCIAVSIAKNCEDCAVYASDVSAEALKTASGNAAKNGVSDRILFLLGPDLEAFRNSSAPKADVIVSNPPYVSESEMEGLEPEVRDYEPLQALNGGPDGLDVIRRIVEESPGMMRPGGELLLEVGMGQSGKVAAYISSRGRYGGAEIRRDYQGIERIVRARTGEQAG